MWSILAAGRGGGERGKNCRQLSYDEARVRSAGEPDTGGAWPDCRDEEKLRTERRNEKRVLQVNIEFMAAAASSHGQKKTNELLLNISHAPLPRHHSQAPLHFSRCDNIPQLHWLELSYPPPSLHFAGYKETDDRSNYPPMMGWLCSYCHHGFVTIVIHLDISSRHHHRPRYLMSLPHCLNLQLAINWEQAIVTNSSDYLRCHIIV